MMKQLKFEGFERKGRKKLGESAIGEIYYAPKVEKKGNELIISFEVKNKYSGVIVEKIFTFDLTEPINYKQKAKISTGRIYAPRGIRVSETHEHRDKVVGEISWGCLSELSRIAYGIFYSKTGKKKETLQKEKEKKLKEEEAKKKKEEEEKAKKDKEQLKLNFEE